MVGLNPHDSKRKVSMTEASMVGKQNGEQTAESKQRNRFPKMQFGHMHSFYNARLVFNELFMYL